MYISADVFFIINVEFTDTIVIPRCYTYGNGSISITLWYNKDDISLRNTKLFFIFLLTEAWILELCSSYDN